MVFHWSLSDSKSPQVSRTLLSILAVLSNAVIWIVSTRPLTPKSFRPFNNPLVIVPKAPITIGTIVTLMFHNFFNSLARSRYLSFFFTFPQFYSVVSWDSKVDNFASSHLLLIIIRSGLQAEIRWYVCMLKSQVCYFLWQVLGCAHTICLFGQIYRFSFFVCIILRSGLLAGIRWSVCILKSHRSLCESFSRTSSGLCIYHLFVWSNWNFLHISQWITLPTQSCLALYSFCANSLHSLIMWLIVSSLSPHSLHLLFCCVLSILHLIWLVLMALSCAAIRRDSVSLFRFPFLARSRFSGV